MQEAPQRNGVTDPIPVPGLVPVLVLALALVLAGCAGGPLRSLERDGPEATPPPDLVRVPDAEPRVEPIRQGGPNKPYDTLGHTYVPITQDAPFTQRGMASWYGKKFHGRPTASGEIYNMYAMTAAHPTLPIPSYARVRNPANGKEVVVRVNDRGPFHGGRILDLSYTAALKLDLLKGVGQVELQRITFEEIRTGAWRRNTDQDGVRLASRLTSSVASGDRSGGDDLVAPPSSRSSSGSTVASPGASATLTPVLSNSAPPQVSAAVAATESSIDAAATAASAPPSANDGNLVVPVQTVPQAVVSNASANAASGEASQPLDAPADRAYTTAARGYWVQLGAFRMRDGAESFHKRVSAELDWLTPLLAVFNDASMFRLQAGPYPTRDEAREVAQRVRAGLQLVPVIVERR